MDVNHVDQLQKLHKMEKLEFEMERIEFTNFLMENVLARTYINLLKLMIIQILIMIENPLYILPVRQIKLEI